MTAFLIAFGPITASVLSIAFIWFLIALANRTRKHSKDLKAKIRKIQGLDDTENFY